MMNQQNGKSAMASTQKKSCGKCKDQVNHSNKKTAEATSRKPASQMFSGMKLHLNPKKVTIPKPFSFDSNSKNESATPRKITTQILQPLKPNLSPKKVTITQPFSFDINSKNDSKSPCRVRDRSVDKPVTTEGNGFKGTRGKQIKVIMDTLKISRSARSESAERAAPPEKTKDEVSNTPAIDSLTSKKPCGRCSRAVTKENSDVKSSKGATNQEERSKTPTMPASPRLHKSEAPNSPKTTCKKTFCSKLAKLQTTKPKEEIPKVPKPKSNLGKSSKSEANSRDNNAHVYNSDKSKGSSSNTEKSNVCVSNKENSEFSSIKEKKAEFVCSKAKNIEGVLISETVQSAVSFKEFSEVLEEATSEYKISGVIEPESILLNGIRHEIESIESEISNEMKKECDIMKSASKIPRIAHSNSGQKIHGNIKNEMLAQTISFENVCPNMNQPTNHMEDILV